MPASASTSGLVGEKDVDAAFVEQPVEAVTMAVDAEHVRQGEGDLAPGLTRHLDCADHGVARSLRIPQIALEIEDRRGADLLLVERARGKVLRGAEEGVHRPVPVGRYQDHRAGGRRADVRGWRDELDAGCGQVVAVEIAELVGSDLADEAGASPERSNSGGGVPRRTAADLVCRTHVRIEPLGLRGVDQPHRALGQAFRVQEAVGRVGDHIDDRIADAQHVEAQVRHEISGKHGKAARLAVEVHSHNVIARSRRRRGKPLLDCFAALAMTVSTNASLIPGFGPVPRRLRHSARSSPRLPCNQLSRSLRNARRRA